MIRHRLLFVVCVTVAVTVIVVTRSAVKFAAAGALLAIPYLISIVRGTDRGRQRRPAAAPDRPLADRVTARVGEPTHAVVRFVLQAQQGPGENWRGQERLWIAVTDTWIWLLHQTADRNIGGVKSRFSRAALHAHWTEHQPNTRHNGELSWPADPWFIAGELHGPRAQRLRLIGLVAADELGIRHLVTRTDTTADNGDHQTRR